VNNIYLNYTIILLDFEHLSLKSFSYSFTRMLGVGSLKEDGK